MEHINTALYTSNLLINHIIKQGKLMIVSTQICARWFLACLKCKHFLNRKTTIFVAAGLDLIIDYDTSNLNWFQLVSDGAVMALSSVTISKYNNRLTVHYHTGIVLRIRVCYFDAGKGHGTPFV
jgi:hypothetical protein